MAGRNRIKTVKIVIGCHDLGANGKCSREVASNHEQVADAQEKLRAIMSKSHLLERSCIQSRATGTCSKEDASNHEQLALAQRKTRSITSKWQMLIIRLLKNRISLIR